MERLTEKVTSKITGKTLAHRLKDGISTLRAIKKLGELEDDLEQGRMIELPCNAGDTVYIFNRTARNDIMKCEIDEFTVSSDGIYAVLNSCELYYAMRRFKAVRIDDFEKSVFTTREAAEQALKEKGNEQSNFNGTTHS